LLDCLKLFRLDRGVRQAIRRGSQEVLHMRVNASLVALATGLLVVAAPILAHHAETAQFDPEDPVTVEGVISKVEWMNPHIWYYVDVTDENGEVTTWGFSGAPPGVLSRRGITQDILKIGDEVRASGNRARDKSNNASGYNVEFSDGRSVFTATPASLQ
jgi:hypothetical protein